MTMSKKKNEIGFVDDAEDKRWEEMKPRTLLVVDGWATVTRNLTARSGKYCGFRHIAWLVITAKGRKSNSVLGIDSSFEPWKNVAQAPPRNLL